MIEVKDLRKGVVFKHQDNQIYLVLEHEHKKLARSKAIIKLKVKNLQKDNIIILHFNSKDKVENLFINKQIFTYLYSDDVLSYFLSKKDSKIVSFDKNKIKNNFIYMPPEIDLEVHFCENKFLKIELPDTVIIKVVKTEDQIKGDSAKPVKKIYLETGLIVKGPLFLKKDDKVEVNTKTGEYISKI
jgi:elongation factor P